MLKGMDWSSIYTFFPWLWRLAHMTIWELSGNLCLNPLTSGISIHTLLAESDQIPFVEDPDEELFQSTLSSQRVTLSLSRCFLPFAISIHTLLAESDWHRGCHWQGTGISIHTLLAESDQLELYHNEILNISIHTLLAESDCNTIRITPLHNPISIHTLLAESDTVIFPRPYVLPISIHTLLAESDGD